MLYLMHRYPADVIDVVHLGEGQRVLIRPVLPQDGDVTTAFFHTLSAPARNNRFLGPMPQLPEQLARHFTQVDYGNHLALVAEVFREQREIVIAEARYVRQGVAAGAEFAVAVADDWQGMGLARLLLCRLLQRAAAAGISRMYGETLVGNGRMINLARRAGFAIVPSPDVHGVVVLERDLTAGAGQFCNDVPAVGAAA